ncbi:6-phospho-3-hexuloisomerase [uncultured Pluralibacter sp.]|uniref:6-phospho-3-hexuloisomerase n=1 Tax=uncultured Pluralibacter sp. TaxID=1490864 RepID=UPI00261C5F0F|nr:6-phospho-3-hexuloisomerase [uncultured Pluralibacter sp.]
MDKITPQAAQQVFSTLFSELGTVFSNIDGEALSEFSAVLLNGRRLFFLGAGRSGLAVKMAAMRFMHLGLAVHAVGEVTCPAIAENDVLLVASGSGRTPMILNAVKTARAAGASVLAVTTSPQTPLAEYAQQQIVLPAAVKDAHNNNVSVQYAGSLFEQATVIVLDALFHLMWKQSALPAETLWARHANME